MKRFLIAGALGLGLGLMWCDVATPQNQGSQRLFPPVDDSSLINHQPWACSQLTANCAYNTIAPNGLDQTTQIQTALDNCSSASVMLGPGIFITTSELLVPPNCVFVAENGINYTPYASSTSNSVIEPGYGFHGTGVVAFNGNIPGQGHFGKIRGIGVNGQYRDYIDFQGYISGTTLTVTSVTTNNLNPGLVPWMDLRDTGSGIARTTKIVNQLTGTTGGVGTYTVTPSQTLGSSGSPVRMGGVVHCFEHILNASFTTVEDLQAVDCTGDGYNITGDGTHPGTGGQGGNNILRPVTHGGFYGYNMGAGIWSAVVEGAVASDHLIDRGPNGGSNTNNTFTHPASADFEFDYTTGQFSGLRAEQDYACGVYLLGTGSATFIDFFSDTNRAGAICMNGSSATFVGGSTFTRDSGLGKAGIVLQSSSSATLDGFAVGTGGSPPHDSFQYTIQADSSSFATGWFPYGAQTYFDTTTQNNVAPFLLINTSGLPTPPATVNLIQQGGAGFTAGWTGGHATVTSGQTDPVGGTNAAKIVEDNTTNTHSASQGIIIKDNGTYNCSVYYKALGVGSARGLIISFSGATGSVYVGANSSGSVTNFGAGGTGVLGSYSSNTTVGSGWIQLVLPASVLGGGVGSVSVQLTSGGSGTYAGDGTSGQFIYQPVCVAGSVAP